MHTPGSFLYSKKPLYLVVVTSVTSFNRRGINRGEESETESQPARTWPDGQAHEQQSWCSYCSE